MGKFMEVIEGIGGAFRMAGAVLTPFWPFWRDWGATPEERKKALPGDEIVPHPRGGYTQAITIDKPCDQVWPWVAQVGQDLGGYYSYEFLENLVGCDIHSADRIVPEYQRTDTSRGLIMYPSAPAIPVHSIQPGKYIVYGGQMDPNTPVSWLFYLDECSENKTRLISRWLFDFKPTFAFKIIYRGFLLPIAAVMQRKMLLGIKKQASRISVSG